MLQEMLVNILGRYLKRRRIRFVNIQFSEMPRKKEKEFLKDLIR